jgi:hypothetical protein
MMGNFTEVNTFTELAEEAGTALREKDLEKIDYLIEVLESWNVGFDEHKRVLSLLNDIKDEIRFGRMA